MAFSCRKFSQEAFSASLSAPGLSCNPFPAVISQNISGAVSIQFFLSLSLSLRARPSRQLPPKFLFFRARIGIVPTFKNSLIGTASAYLFFLLRSELDTHE